VARDLDGGAVTGGAGADVMTGGTEADTFVFAAGDSITVIQNGAGLVTFSQASVVTINSTGATATAPKLRVRYSSATAVYEGSNIWYVVGDIA
jgi:Ca2+-binding RTX toxin-like protein